MGSQLKMSSKRKVLTFLSKVEDTVCNRADICKSMRTPPDRLRELVQAKQLLTASHSQR